MKKKQRNCPTGSKRLRVISSSSSDVKKIHRNSPGESRSTERAKPETAIPRVGNLGLLNRKAAALYTGISERSIQRHKDNGDLPFYKLGGLIRYLPADLDAFPVRFASKGRKKGGSA